MIPTALTLYLLIDLGLLAWSFTFDRPHRGRIARARLWFLRVLLLGMAYDNLVLSLSGAGISASWYELANWPRFILHAAVLPFLTIFALSALQSCDRTVDRDTAIAQDKTITPGKLLATFCWAFTLAALAYGLWFEVWLLQLEPRTVMEHTRLTSASNTPPWATIATNILVLVMAFRFWLASGFWVFFLGAALIFIVNGATGAQPWGYLVGNGVEVIFICTLLITERFLVRRF